MWVKIEFYISVLQGLTLEVLMPSIAGLAFLFSLKQENLKEKLAFNLARFSYVLIQIVYNFM